MPKKRTPLTRALVLESALKILDRDGMDGLSMRKLAATLKVEAMSLYNHVKDKQDLYDGLVNLVLARIQPPSADLPWDKRLEIIALSLYQALVEHPALVLMLASEQGRPNDNQVLQGMDLIAATLAESGLCAAHQVSAFRGLLVICFGFVLAHTQGLSMPRNKAEAVWQTWDSQQWNTPSLPHLAKLAPQFLQTHADEDLTFMLAAYINALKSSARV